MLSLVVSSIAFVVISGLGCWLWLGLLEMTTWCVRLLGGIPEAPLRNKRRRPDWRRKTTPICCSLEKGILDDFDRLSSFLLVIPTEILGEPKKSGLGLGSDEGDEVYHNGLIER